MLLMACDTERKCRKLSELKNRLNGFDFSDMVEVLYDKKGNLIGGDMLPTLEEVLSTAKTDIRIEITEKYDVVSINPANGEKVIYRRLKDNISEKQVENLLGTLANGKVTQRALTSKTSSIGREMMKHLIKNK